MSFRTRAAAAAAIVGLVAQPALGQPPVRVVIDPARPLSTFTPDEALGAALDGMEQGGVARTLTPFNIAQMRSAGLRRLTYRTRPELGAEVWHWTDKGSWSDPSRQQGYWTGDDAAPDPGPVTWGYSLPRRGDTLDNANNLGYSRIDDGDPQSFWKSNPYLDRRYTGAAVSRPQWIVFFFGARTPVDAARILWGAPFARHYVVQYWKPQDPHWEGKEAPYHPGRWVTFPSGDQTITGEPGEGVLRLSATPVAVSFVRILLLQSSETGPAGSTDIRDRLGYAVREAGLGVQRPDGGFDDKVRHGASKDAQTLVEVSSTDPWHRAVDLDVWTEQPSLDLVVGSGLGGDGAPLMVPVGVFYDTPENAAAEIRYVRRRGWPVRQVELGEEPDGQVILPEDYADLYLETAQALHNLDPTLQLGGPSMQDPLTDTWPDPGGGESWPGRFVAELKARGGLGELQFFSFEHYAFDNVCRPAGDMLREETGALDDILDKTAAAGVPRTIPWVISEYGFSPFAGRVMSDTPSALLAADIVGHFLSAGGSAAYMFGYPPNDVASQAAPCAGFGNLMLFQAGDDGQARWPMPVYYAERMMLDDWGAPADQSHSLYAASAPISDAQGRPMIVAYPLRGPDGRWSVLLINRDSRRAHAVSLVFAGAGRTLGADGGLSVVQYSPAQYQWRDRGAASRPARDLPPGRFSLLGGRPLTLPPFSLTVATGSGPVSPP